MPLLPEDEKNALDELQAKLDQGTLADVRLKRSHLSASDGDQGGWPEEVVDDFGEDGHKSSWRRIKKFFIVAAVFFIVAVGITSIVIIRGGNLISNSNIDLTVNGPVSLRAGEELNLQVMVTNHNRVSLESARLLAEYPAGTRASADVSAEWKREAVELKSLTPGESVNKVFRALLFGGQGSQQMVKLTLEYRLSGSNNVFTKTGNYLLTISEAPITLTATLPAAMNAGREFSFTIDLVSNSPATLPNILLAVAYPPGFEFKSADPKPALDNHLWSLGDLAAGLKKQITITGVLSGQENEVKSFRATVGPAGNDNGSQITFAYGDILSTVAIHRPFVGANLVLNGDSGEQITVLPGQKLTNQAVWANSLPTDVSDLRLELSLSGNIIDRRSVQAELGFYDSQTDRIVWDKTTLPALAALAPGGSNSSSFSFSILPLSDLTGNLARNPQASLSLVVTGRRVIAGNQAETVRTEIRRQIKILSVPQIAPQLLYGAGPFANSGPTAPKVGRQTTYTVTWSVANPSNEVSGGTAVATLPNYVKWQSVVSPQNEKLSFNESTRAITWDLGVIPAGLGFDGAPREVSFQIALTPSLSQVGESPVLISAVNLSGTDTFTGTPAGSNRGALNTSSLNETGFETGAGVVSE